MKKRSGLMVLAFGASVFGCGFAQEVDQELKADYEMSIDCHNNPKARDYVGLRELSETLVEAPVAFLPEFRVALFASQRDKKIINVRVTVGEISTNQTTSTAIIDESMSPTTIDDRPLIVSVDGRELTTNHAGQSLGKVGETAELLGGLPSATGPKGYINADTSVTLACVED